MIHGQQNLVLLEAGNKGYEAYQEQHLDSALYLDLDTDLADIPKDPANGGRHPLPQIDSFVAKMGKLGLSFDKQVVIYDRNQGANSAARLWWMLTAIGHPNVHVLNGGFQVAQQFAYPSNAIEIVPVPTVLESPVNWKLPLAQMAEVEAKISDKTGLIIDVREAKRFLGEIEPIDLVAGHIPGAVNVPFKENLDENGCFLPAAVLKEKYEKLLKNRAMEEVVVHCGSGVTACHTLLALAHAGFEIPKLYVGSWSEWSRSDKKMVLKK